MDMEPGKSGGTWLGMTKTGRFATLTNYRQRISDVKSDVLGRGYLVVDFLRGQMSPEDYLKPLEEKRSQYNGFNILALDLRLREICYFTNMEDKEMQKLTPGIYGLSNKTLEDPWAKLVHGKQKFSDALQSYAGSQEKLIEELLEIMSDDTCRHPGGNYPLLDWPEEYTKYCSSVFVKGFQTPLGAYGTRTTTIILVDGKDHVTFVERTLDDPIELGTYKWKTQKFDFSM
jgi:uncharacterized protein with NRDE domain